MSSLFLRICSILVFRRSFAGGCPCFIGFHSTGSFNMLKNSMVFCASFSWIEPWSHVGDFSILRQTTMFRICRRYADIASIYSNFHESLNMNTLYMLRRYLPLDIKFNMCIVLLVDSGYQRYRVPDTTGTVNTIRISNDFDASTFCKELFHHSCWS